MKEIEILPYIENLVSVFFRSSHDALNRAQHPSIDADKAEKQASIESIVFAFLTVEAMLNYLFYSVQDRQLNGLDKWVFDKWKGNISIRDRFDLFVLRCTSCNLDDFEYLVSLFRDFIVFRNRLVHAKPVKYLALIERQPTNELLLHDLELVESTNQFSSSGLSSEIRNINCNDAKRCFEIMLLLVCFLHEQCHEEWEFQWPNKNEERYMSPKDIIQAMSERYYPKLKTEHLIPNLL